MSSSNLKLDGNASKAVSDLQNTKLPPLEEILFTSWAKANQVKNPDEEAGEVDLRGIYQSTGGKVLPFGELKRIVRSVNNEKTLEGVLRDRVMAQSDKVAQGAEKSKQQEENMKHKILQSAAAEPGPRQLESQMLENEGKKLDLQKQMIAAEMKSNGPREAGQA